MAQYDLGNFTNIDQETFIGKWDNEEYEILAGETKAFPTFLVDHFCKHLADKMLMREDKYHLESERIKLVEQMKGGVVSKKEIQEEIPTGKKFKEEVEKEQKELDEKANKLQEEITKKKEELLKKSKTK